MNLSHDCSLMIRRCGATFHIVRKGSLTGYVAGPEVAPDPPDCFLDHKDGTHYFLTRGPHPLQIAHTH